MTTTNGTVSCGMWRGITTPAGWEPMKLPTEMVAKAEAKRSDAKVFAKYAAACAMALDLSADGLTRDGKALKEADLFIALLDGHLEAVAQAEAVRKAAEQAKAEALAKAQRMTKLEADIKEAQAKGGITYEMMLAWANIARESGAYLVMHGGTDQGSGISVRFTQAPKEASAPRAPRETGGGSKGGTETRVSAYAEALRFQAKGNAPHNITRTGTTKADYKYFDHGKEVTEALAKYLQRVYADAPVGISLKGYDERRKAAKGNASA